MLSVNPVTTNAWCPEDAIALQQIACLMHTVIFRHGEKPHMDSVPGYL